MMPVDRFERDLRVWFEADATGTIPSGLHEHAIDKARHARQRARWLAALHRGAPTGWAVVSGVGATALWVLIAFALVVGILAAAAVGGQLMFEPKPAQVVAPSSKPASSSTPRPPASSTPAAHQPVGSQFAVEQYVEDGLMSGMTTASRQFALPVTFQLLAASGDVRAPVGPSWWCADGSQQTSSRMIALFYMKGCVTEMRFLRPFAVDCGTPDAHPDAETLAAAILARPSLARDLGDLRDSDAVPDRLVLGDYPGHVIQTGLPRRDFAPDSLDPDRCRLVADPATGDPTIEIRSDMPAMLLLMDVHDELVVLRWAGGGYDGPSGAKADERGYLDRDTSNVMTEIYDIHWN